MLAAASWHLLEQRALRLKGLLAGNAVSPASVPSGITSQFRQQPYVIDFYADRLEDAILIRNTDGTIQGWNQGAKRLYGWDANEAVGKTSHFLLKTIFPCSLSSIETQLVQRGFWEGKLIHKCRDGAQLVVHSKWLLLHEVENSDAVVYEVNSQKVQMDKHWKEAYES